MNRKRACLFTLCCSVGVVAACAQHHEGGVPAGATSAPRSPSAQAPRRVTRAELLERMRVPLSRSDDGLRFTPHGAHAARLDLQGRAQHAAVAHVDRDGRLRITCVDSLAGAERALSGAADAP